MLQVPFLSPEQLAASFEVMTLDMQLIDDGTYFVAEEDGIVVGCGGWTCRRGFVTGQRLTHPDGELLVPSATRRASGPCIPIRTTQETVLGVLS